MCVLSVKVSMRKKSGSPYSLILCRAHKYDTQILDRNVNPYINDLGFFFFFFFFLNKNYTSFTYKMPCDFDIFILFIYLLFFFFFCNVHAHINMVCYKLCVRVSV